MIVPDANLLVYAYDASAPDHESARSWWEEVLSGNEPVGIPWVVVLAFVRLMTHPTLSENPMSVAQARIPVEAWMALEHVRLLGPRDGTMTLFFDMLDRAGAGGNLSTDALIAAQAQEYGGVVYSNDRDFDRFENVAWRNPLAPQGK